MYELMVRNGKNLSHFDGTKCFMSWSSKDAALVAIVIFDRLRHENDNFTESVVDAYVSVTIRDTTSHIVML